jgi:peptidoglycan LD-endopeptidase LytH
VKAAREGVSVAMIGFAAAAIFFALFAGAVDVPPTLPAVQPVQSAQSVQAPAAELPAPGPQIPVAPGTGTDARATVEEPRGPDEVLIIPVQGVRASQLRDTFSDARGSGRSHDAIDIMAPHNTPVLAAAPAVVVRQDSGARGGIALYALGADQRTIYYYAHLDRYAEGIVEGKTLRAGDVIGYVGDTGNAGAGNYHLHFEITTTNDPKKYWNGVSLNPYRVLRTGITRD